MIGGVLVRWIRRLERRERSGWGDEDASGWNGPVRGCEDGD